MATNGTLAVAMTVGGITINKQIIKSADGQATAQASLSAGKDVTGWVSTAVNAADCNLAANHGQTNGTYDVYWNGGLRYGVTGVVDTNALNLVGGAGDNFPANATNGIVVCKQEQVNIAIDGDEVELFGAMGTVRSHIDFQDSGGASVSAMELVANSPYTWYANSGINCPLTGNAITKAMCSVGVNTAGSVDILALQDSTP